MECDYGWKALCRPGGATDHFEPVPLPEFDVNAPGYSDAVSWWLAELSRLVYRQVAAVSARRPPVVTRQQILARANLQEAHFLDRGGTQCAVLVPRTTVPEPFGVLVFGGTTRLMDWRANLYAGLVRHRSAKVHGGFLRALDVIWSDLVTRLRDVAGPLFYTGHSQGAALATLSASRQPPRAVYTFGSPRVGDGDFVRSLAHTRIYRVVHGADVVTVVPPRIGKHCFRHVGELHYLARDGRQLVDPPAREMSADRFVGTAGLRRSGGRSGDRTVGRVGGRGGGWRRWLGPPPFLADHAPVNYVSHLQRRLSQGQTHHGDPGRVGRRQQA